MDGRLAGGMLGDRVRSRERSGYPPKVERERRSRDDDNHNSGVICISPLKSISRPFRLKIIYVNTARMRISLYCVQV